MFVHTVIMVIEPHMKQGRQHKLISTIFLATSVTKKLDHNTPKEFAENTAEQLGIDSAAPQKRKGIISSVAALVVAVAAFVIYATTQSGKVPDGAIGQADAMTNIQVEGAFGFDASQIILAVGVIAVTIAIIQIIRTVRKNRR